MMSISVCWDNVTFSLEYCIIKIMVFLPSKIMVFFLIINLHSIERWYEWYESTCIGRASFETYTLCHRYRVHQGPFSGKTYARKKICKVQLWFSVKKKLQQCWWSYFTFSPTGSKVAILVEVIQTPSLTNFQIFF